jgi:hypothetical protein
MSNAPPETNLPNIERSKRRIFDQYTVLRVSTQNLGEAIVAYIQDVERRQALLTLKEKDKKPSPPKEAPHDKE